MPKMNEYPRLREHRRARDGKVVTYYFYDRRLERLPDVALGTDYDAALRLWAECRDGRPPSAVLRAAKAPKRKRAARFPAPKPRRRRKLAGEAWEALPVWARRMYLNAETRARTLGRAFSLSPEAFIRLVEDSGGKCAVTGYPMDLQARADESRHPFAPSLDRIESSKGYEAGNVRLVCMVVNFAMNKWGEGPLMKIIEHCNRLTAADR